MAQTPAAPRRLTGEEAFQVLHQRTYVPTFFQKVATDLNWVPRTDHEAYTALTMACKLREAYDQAQQKQASAVGNFLQQASQELDAVLGVEQPTRFQVAIKEAAVHGSFDPELATAVLSQFIADQQQ